MDPSQQQHQQEMATHSTLEDVLNCSSKQQQQQEQRRLSRPQQEQALKCPRCDSSNTKFCYYNNYSLTQPRYFCKACRRYWTKGGSLRNVPVGGGCRKNNKRSSSSSSSSKFKSQDNNNQILINTNPSNPLLTFPSSLSYDTNDLTLAFGRLHKQPTRQLGFDEHESSSTTSIFGNPNHHHHHHQNDNIGNLNTTSSSNNHGFIDVLRGGFLDPTSGFHNFYSGFGNGLSLGDNEQIENNGGGENNQVVLPYEEMGNGIVTGLTDTTSTITTSTNQELFKDRTKENVETRVLWNFPWHAQFAAADQSSNNNNMGSFVDSSGRSDCWNGSLGSSSWPGLVNSPLM